MDIETFYEADERRRRSEEIELGTDWFDGDGARYEVSWVADTGELYVMREPLVPMIEDPFGGDWKGFLNVDELSVRVVGWIPDRATMEQILTGWEGEMTKPNGVAWLAERLRTSGVPTAAPESA